MARLVTIESIEGNSHLGNPVFSKYAKMANYQYLVLTPMKEEDKAEDEGPNGPLKEENIQFRIKRPVTESAP